MYTKNSYEIFKMFLKDHTHVGAVTASSPWLVKEIVSSIPPHSEPLKILEIGFGTGVVTGEIVA